MSQLLDIDVWSSDIDGYGADIDVKFSDIDIWRAAVDGFGEAVDVTDSAIDIWSATIDGYGEAIDVTVSDIDIWRAAVDGFGEAIDVTVSDINVWRAASDGFGEAIDVTVSDINVWRAAIDGYGEAVDVTAFRYRRPENTSKSFIVHPARRSAHRPQQRRIPRRLQIMKGVIEVRGDIRLQLVSPVGPRLAAQPRVRSQRVPQERFTEVTEPARAPTLPLT